MELSNLELLIYGFPIVLSIASLIYAIGAEASVRSHLKNHKRNLYLKDVGFKNERFDGLEPEYKSDLASGFDLPSNEFMILKPRETRVVPTGWFFELPEHIEMEVRPRSGTSLKTKLRIANTPGTVDEDYRGMVGIICENTGDERITIEHGERIAQGVLGYVVKGNFIKKDALSKTKRGHGAYGHTGTK